MGHILKLLASVSQCVCHRSYGRNFYSIFMKFYTVVRGLKSKIEFVWGESLMTSSPVLPQFFLPPQCVLNGKVLIPQEDSKEARRPIIRVNSSKTCLDGCYRRKPEKYFYPLICLLTPEMAIAAFTMIIVWLMFDTRYLSNSTMRDRGVVSMDHL